jgi:hypothetical protein
MDTEEKLGYNCVKPTASSLTMAMKIMDSLL